MICSEKELGISDEHEGIMILDSSLKKGQGLGIALSLEEDTIFDFDMTPNRGDCFSHLGIARELNIIENGKHEIKGKYYSLSELAQSKWNTKDLIQVNIKDSDLCSRYACRIIKNIKVRENVDIYPIITYILTMKEKVITIKAKGISQKQWSVLLLEFNLIAKAWRKVGVDLHIAAPGLARTLAWGTRKHNEPDA